MTRPVVTVLVGMVLVLLILVLRYRFRRGDTFDPGQAAQRCTLCGHLRAEHGRLASDFLLRCPCLHAGCTCPAFIPPEPPQNRTLRVPRPRPAH